MSGMSRLFVVFLAGSVFSLFPLSGSAQVDCTVLPQWVKLDNGLQFNQRHVFCGEWKGDRAKGFHSRPGGVNPEILNNFTVQDAPNAAGIYTGKWSYKNHPGRNKFSTMFPDNGSGVKENAEDYCTNNGEFFLISFAPPGGNKINTAFPLRQ